MIAAIITDMPESVSSWVGRSDALTMGCWYFALCGLVELSGFYQIGFWDKIATESKKKMVEVKTEPADAACPYLASSTAGCGPSS